jgi:hypothetical protein
MIQSCMSRISSGEGGVPALHLKLPQVMHSRLCAFTNDAKQMVLVHVAAEDRRQADRAQRPQPLDVSEQITGIGRAGRLPQPSQRALFTAFPKFEQCIQRSPLCVGEPRREASVQPALRASGNLRVEPFDDPNRRCRCGSGLG